MLPPTFLIRESAALLPLVALAVAFAGLDGNPVSSLVHRLNHISPWRLRFRRPSFFRPLEIGDADLSLVEEGEEGTYELDGLTFILLIAVDITTVFISTFVDTAQTLAFKGAFISIIGVVGLAAMGVFGLVMYQGGVQVYSIRKGVNYLGIGIGILGTTVLVIIQYAIFLYVGRAVLATIATLKLDAATAALFYTSSAVNETFAFEGAMYTILVKVFAGFEEEESLADHLGANVIVSAAAGLNHFAVYNAQLPQVLAVALGFFFLNLLYGLTGSLIVPLVAHLFLNLLSTSGGSVFGLTTFSVAWSPLGEAMILVEVAVVLVVALVILLRRRRLKARTKGLKGLISQLLHGKSTVERPISASGGRV